MATAMTYTLMDLFAGCGAMTRGFVDAERFEPVFAVESDADAAVSFAANFGGGIAATAPIENVSSFPRVDVIIGGPPCQGFSTLNRSRVGFERRALWRHYLRALEEAEPIAFVMENVPQLLKSPEYAAFVVEAQLLGFNITQNVLLAADFGVAQLRRRAFVVGVRGAAASLPTATHEGGQSMTLSGLPRWRTVREAFTLPTPLPEQPDGHSWHRSRRPTALSEERYRIIPDEGEGRFELAARRPDLTPACWLRKTSGTTDVFGRLWWDRPAATIRTEFYKPEKGRYLHPRQHRALTVREAARLMSIPDDFVLPEHQHMTSIARQIGNAVPCLVAQRVAEHLAELLDAHLAAIPQPSDGELILAA